MEDTMASAVSDRVRLLRDGEAGVSLVELLVAASLSMVLLLAAFSLYEASSRSELMSNNRSEAVLEARDGLERMTRELRQALPVTGQSPLLQSATNVVFQTVVPGTATQTTPPVRWVRYDCGAGNACRRTTSAVFPPPTNGGDTIVSGLVTNDVFALPQTNFISVKLAVRVPGQNSPVTMRNGVTIRNVP
jgi:hypothetical protein